MATANPLAGAADHLQGAAGCGQAPCKGRAAVAKAPMQRGDRLRQGPLQRGDRLHHSTRKGRQPPAATPQGLLPTRHYPQGLSPARAAAINDNTYRGGSHGGVDRRGGRPLAEWLPTGKGSRRLRRGNSGGDDAVRVKEGYDNFFKKMICPLTFGKF
ncbi:hypothetical protein GW17_00060114 [Ensete ventricosum]|nr:hypothetical protein GW17_00060114 [Ensete ventricosum]